MKGEFILKLDLVGKVVGDLTVIRLLEKKDRNDSNYKGSVWECQCSCGAITQVRGAYLTGNGNYTQTSCGCHRVKDHFIKTNKLKLDKEYVYSFLDFEKYAFLHKAAFHSNSPLKHFDTDMYKAYIEKFYNDKQFNATYIFWKRSESSLKTYYNWSKPSLDHKTPLSRGGTNTLDNLQFLTVFENLAKRDLTWEEWIIFKKETNTISNYFLENIMPKGGKDLE